MSRAKYVVSRVLPLSNLELIDSSVNFMEINGVPFHYDYEKVKTFKRSCTCINCGLEASEMRLEKIKSCAHPVYGEVHLNLYGYTHKGREVLFTVDHAILKSLAGPDRTENYNTMCSRCNYRRGAKYPNLQDFLDIYKDVSTEKYWDDAEIHDAEKVARERARNLARRDAYLGKRKETKDSFLNSSMHHHVGLYNRFMKKLKKELTENS